MPARVPVTTAARSVVATTALLGLAAGLTACSSSGGVSTAGGAKLTVTSTDTECRVSTAALPAGRHTFSVSNSGSQVTEVYVYGPGDRIVGEVENIGPGITRALTVDLAAGSFEVACKPGQSGDGIRSALTVSGAASSSSSAASTQLIAPVTSYRTYVEQQAVALQTATAAFVAAVEAGDVTKARALYAPARLHWERIEPVAEAFGDLDPRIDMRIDDVTEGTEFTGFHRLEQDLWQKKDIAASGPVAARLLADVRELVGRIPSAGITALTMANGAKALLDEVAKSKVTGEEERYSRIDLVDFLGNVQGSKQAFESLEPALATADAGLVSTLDTRFDALLDLLARHRSSTDAVPGSGFVAYDDLSQAEVRALAVAVDDLSEPLGRLAAAVAAL